MHNEAKALRRRPLIAGGTALFATLAAPAVLRGQDLAPLAIGLTRWTGFAPLILADRTGIFTDHGLQVDLHLLPMAACRQGLLDGSLNSAALSMDEAIGWAAGGVKLQQVVVLDRSMGGHALAARPAIQRPAGLQGRTVAIDAPGSASAFLLAAALQKDGLPPNAVTHQVMEPAAAAKAFIAGTVDACVTYEPYLSAVRDMDADRMHLLATSLDTPIIGTLAVSPLLVAHNSETVARLVRAWFAATDMIRLEPDNSFTQMGASVGQDAGACAVSAGYLAWQSRGDNRALADDGLAGAMAAAAAALVQAGEIPAAPALNGLWDGRFVG